MSYAIIKLAGKQYRVQEGERILVDRLAQDEGKTFHPDVLLFADDGKTRVRAEGRAGDGQDRVAHAGRQDPGRQVPPQDGLQASTPATAAGCPR